MAIVKQLSSFESLKPRLTDNFQSLYLFSFALIPVILLLKRFELVPMILLLKMDQQTLYNLQTHSILSNPLPISFQGILILNFRTKTQAKTKTSKNTSEMQMQMQNALCKMQNVKFKNTSFMQNCQI